MSSFTFDVFISYSHRDADWVRSWLLPRLEAAGLSVCIDVRDFKIGVPSLINMDNAVEQSRKTLLVVTPNWLQSEWTKFESLLSQAEDPSGVRQQTLPLLLEQCQLPKRFGILTYADFTDPANRDSQLARLIADINLSPAPNSLSLPNIQPNLVHPYALQANFTGRVNERHELTDWLADDAHPICALVAMGGMGKSALAWYWMQHDVLHEAAPTVEGVMWWSFYEGESSFAKFIDEALKYVSGQQTIDAALFPTTYDRAQELRKQLQHKRVLFILDGFERQLRAYASLDAAYRADDDARPRDDRSCVDPVAARLLNDIAAATTHAKVLINTRLMVRDLEDQAGDALAGVLNRELKGLPRNDALEFMREQGVTKGTPTEIAIACEDYGYHPLSLRLLSGLIAHDMRTPGDIAAAPRHDVHDDLIRRRHHILEQSYNALPKEERALLSRIAAFHSPMDYDTLVIFNKFGLFKRPNVKKFNIALEDLQVRGLLQRDMVRNRYDLHPIVRRYAYDRLKDKVDVHTRLRYHFESIPAPHVNRVQSIEDLLPTIERYHHTARAGRFDTAFHLFRDLLHKPLFYSFGAYQICIELLRVLFPDGEDRPPRLIEEIDQAWALHALANSYTVSGQPRGAVRLSDLANTLVEKQVNKGNISIGLGNIASSQIVLGQLAAAETNLQRSIELCREIGAESIESTNHQQWGRLLSYRGAFDEAAERLEIAARYWEQTNNKQGICLDESYRALRALLMNDARAAVVAAQHASEFWKVYAEEIFPVEHSRVRVEWLWGAALIMEGKDLNAANAHLTEALSRCRRINLVDYEPDILHTWARWYRARGDGREALAYAKEALAIADRCEFRLKQAEIHNFMARLELDEGEREVAQQHAEVAKERAWCDGPPHCYKPALDEAEGMLRELGAEE